MSDEIIFNGDDLIESIKDVRDDIKKFKSVTFNKKGLTRADNVLPKFSIPKKDLNKKNRRVTYDGHYTIIEKISDEDIKD